MAEDDRPPAAAAAFERAYAGRMVTTVGLVVGHESGLLARLAAGPGTAAAIASDAGTDPRMTLEWLRVMTIGGFATFADDVFAPADGLGEVLEVPGGGSRIALFVAGVRRDAALLDRWVEAVRTGAGISHVHFEPVSSRSQDLYNVGMMTEHLVPDLLGPVAGLLDRLAAGCAVLDLGCGGGRALQVLASTFPSSTYHGYDLDEVALQLARERTTALGADIVLERRDVAHLPAHAFDLVLAIDTIHDLGDPLGTVRSVAASLRPGGVFVMAETDATGDFAVDRHSESASEYLTSLAMCIPVSQAAGGPGLGSLWGRAAALRLLRQAGFTSVEVAGSPTGHAVFASRSDRPTGRPSPD